MITQHVTRIALSTIAGTGLAVSIAGGALAPHGVAQAAAPPAGKALVAVAHRARFGTILVNGRGFALYYWARETNGKVKCTGQCARVWPPVLLPAGARAPRHVAGVMGTFGVVMRPGGTHQLAFNRHPLYTYQGDKTPAQILCDGVDGWHVYRLSH
jgi:predicted lipoprotein with Yx(FWY)xxD motif